MTILKWVLLIILSYALGNVSVARIISRIKKDDITKHGSGNPGTMNMIRTFGVGTGLLTLFFDCLKGALPALAGYLLFLGEGMIMANTALYAAGLAVVFGHMYPVVYKFKGGKSVACALGIFCVANPILLVCVFCASILYLYFFDYGAVFSFIVLTICTAVEAISFQGNLAISLLQRVDKHHASTVLVLMDELECIAKRRIVLGAVRLMRMTREQSQSSVHLILQLHTHSKMSYTISLLNCV